MKESKLRTARKALGLTLDEACLRADFIVDRASLSRAERGYVKLKPEQLKKLASVLKVKVKDLS
jgi:transcriptional regulator with XRE-family HTH domain